MLFCAACGSRQATQVAIWRNRDTLGYLALLSLSDGFVYRRIKLPVLRLMMRPVIR